MSHEPLTVGTAVAIAEIARMANDTAKIARAMPDGNLVYGHARYIERSTSSDVRDATLRVTKRSGFEVWWPMSELIEARKDGLLSAYEWDARDI